MRSASPSTLRSLLVARNTLSRKPSNYSTAHNHLCRINFSSSLTPSSKNHINDISDETEVEESEEWEEEEDTDPVIGDGGDGGGIVLRDVSWGEQTLAVARQVLSEHFGDDLTIYAFKVSPKGYVYIRLDKLTTKYGCPDIEEIESFNNIYAERLDELTEKGEIPIDLAVEVSSPGAERLLKVPEDLNRFKEMPMWVQYLNAAEDGSTTNIHEKEKEGIFLLESMEHENQHCVLEACRCEGEQS